MNATLTFNLPEEDTQFRDAIHGALWHTLVAELTEEMRTRLKHGDDVPYYERCVLEEWKRKIHYLVEEKGLEL